MAVAKKAYESLYGKEPEIMAIHAGLECGLFLEKYPHLDMISCGPTIRNAHSPERTDRNSFCCQMVAFLIGSVEEYSG